MISKTLKAAVTFYGLGLLFVARGISAHSLQVSGTMVILCTVTNSNVIKKSLWSINKIMHYLHVQADTIMRKLSLIILDRVKDYFLTHHESPCY